MSNNQNLFAELIDELLYFGSGAQFEQEINDAKDIFSKTDQQEIQLSTDAGFNDWYIHDYKLKSELYIADLYRKDNDLNKDQKEILDSVSASILSVFEVRGEEGSYFLKDIFTQRDYGIESQEEIEFLDKKSLQFIRLYPYKGQFVLNTESKSLGYNFKEILVKTFMEQYNKYAKSLGVAEVEEFAYNNPLMVYKIVHILEDLDAETMYDNDEYLVYQSVFLYTELNKILEIMNNHPLFECSLEEGGSYVYKLYETEAKENIISEIVLCDNRLESECLNDIDLQAAKKSIARSVGRCSYFFAG